MHTYRHVTSDAPETNSQKLSSAHGNDFQESRRWEIKIYFGRRRRWISAEAQLRLSWGSTEAQLSAAQLNAGELSRTQPNAAQLSSTQLNLGQFSWAELASPSVTRPDAAQFSLSRTRELLKVRIDEFKVP